MPELVADVGFAGEPRQQPRERLGLFGLERDAPRPLRRIPAASGDRAKQHAQALVIGEPEHCLVALERGGECGG